MYGIILTVAEVPAAGVVDAGQALQLQEVFLLAAELTVATLLWACKRWRLVNSYRVGFGLQKVSTYKP